MRLTRFSITNYRGIRAAEFEGLADRPVTMLTGRNGTGKSLVLEALTATWSGSINLPEFVGPYGNSLSVTLGVTLDEAEYATVNHWRTSRDLNSIDPTDEHVLEAVSTNREATGFYRQSDDVLATLRNPLFASEHPFASIDLLSARRQVSLSTSTSVDLAMLNRGSVVAQRQAMYEQEIRWKSGMQMPDVGSYLTSLDYRDYIASRAGYERMGEYERLQEAFFKATQKMITLPEFDPLSAHSSISVALPSGFRHALDDLSNGERELLGMLYFVSQISSLGGVLLIDEPEKHLHPSLQASVLSSMMSVADRGQVLVVTHSPSLISSASSDSVLVVNPAWEGSGNQVQVIADAQGHADALAELGLTPRDLMQCSFLLLVEGPQDEARLRMLFPEEVAGARIVAAGGRTAALQTARALRDIGLTIPWLCVVDRDFLTERECGALEESGDIFVWRTRALEGNLLDKALLRSVVSPLQPTGPDVSDVLLEALELHREGALNQFVEARARNAAPTGAVADESFTDDRVLRRLMSERDSWQARIDEYENVRAQVLEDFELNWGNSPERYVDPKRVLAEIQRKCPVFRDATTLADALSVRAREIPDLEPSEFARLRQEMQRRLLPAFDASGLSTIEGQDLDAEVAAAISSGVEPDPRLNDSPQDWQGC